jgi:hypothetical protein
MIRMNKHLPYLNSIVFRFRVISGLSWFLVLVSLCFSERLC